MTRKQQARVVHAQAQAAFWQRVMTVPVNASPKRLRNFFEARARAMRSLPVATCRWVQKRFEVPDGWDVDPVSGRPLGFPSAHEMEKDNKACAEELKSAPPYDEAISRMIS